MITGVQDVYYYVSDMARAIKFYRDTLGLRVTHQSDDWTSLDVGGVRLGLHGTGGKPVPRVPKGPDGALAGGTLTLRTTDIRADVQRLRSAGVKFIGEIEDADWGSIIAFEDPDGNVLKLMQPPAR